MITRWLYKRRLQQRRRRNRNSRTQSIQLRPVENIGLLGDFAVDHQVGMSEVAVSFVTLESAKRTSLLNHPSCGVALPFHSEHAFPCSHVEIHPAVAERKCGVSSKESFTRCDFSKDSGIPYLL